MFLVETSEDCERFIPQVKTISLSPSLKCYHQKSHVRITAVYLQRQTKPNAFKAHCTLATDDSAPSIHMTLFMSGTSLCGGSSLDLSFCTFSLSVPSGSPVSSRKRKSPRPRCRSPRCCRPRPALQTERSARSRPCRWTCRSGWRI